MLYQRYTNAITKYFSEYNQSIKTDADLNAF